MTHRPLHVLGAVVIAAVLVAIAWAVGTGEPALPGGPDAGGRHGLVLTDAMG